MQVLVTGGAGFIGSNYIRYALKAHPDWEIWNLDKLTYAGNLANLKDIENDPRYHFVQGDIADPKIVAEVMRNGIEIIINFAAESHNSYAVKNPTVFFQTNVLGTQCLLEAARHSGVTRFHHISTCEVYGDLPLDSQLLFTEDSPYRPRTPYNASKAASDLVVRAYGDTFKIAVTISNCSNNYGPYQFPEKLIPLFVTNLIDGKRVPLYRQSQNRREWLHVHDHCRAIDLVLAKGRVGETYNIGSGVEKSVEEITAIILQELGLTEEWKMYVDDRPGHDRRYLLDSSKIRRELGWSPLIDFAKGIKETIAWYKNNEAWWRSVKSRSPVVEDAWETKTRS